MKHVYDMIVAGGGPAGYSAALYAARAGLDVVVLEKLSAGGQMALTTQIDNYPGFVDGVDGFELAEQMQAQAERFGAKSEYAEIIAMNLGDAIKTVETSEGIFYGKTVVIALGAEARMLGVEKEQELTGRGVAYCAACDGMFFKDKTVAVVGGGNSAVADALTLARIAKKVYLIHRRDTLRADKVYHNALYQADNLGFIWNHAVSGLEADSKLKGLKLKDVKTGVEQYLACDGLFISVGRKPSSELVSGQLELDESGYIVADESTQTSLPGVFAAGDIRTKTLRQVVTAVSDGAMAVHSAEAYLAQHQES